MFTVPELLSVAPEPPSPERDLAGMSWLAGSWTGPMWGGQFTAYYSTPEGAAPQNHVAPIGRSLQDERRG